MEQCSNLTWDNHYSDFKGGGDVTHNDVLALPEVGTLCMCSTRHNTEARHL